MTTRSTKSPAIENAIPEKPRRAQTIAMGAAGIGACAVCCAPFLAPSLVAAFATGGTAWIVLRELWCLLPVLLGPIGVLLLFRHRSRRRARACACATACALPASSEL